MRDYASVSPQFWIGKTGKRLRTCVEAQLVAMYLVTSPHSNMLGLYYLPVMYIAHETGLGLEGASKGLQRAIEAGFCTYDDDNEMVWVHEMGRFQIGEGLAASDNRVKGIHRALDALPSTQLKQQFKARYAKDFHFPVETKTERPSEAPSKPLRSQDQEQDQDQEEKHLTSFGVDAALAQPNTPPSNVTELPTKQPAQPEPATKPPATRGTRLSPDWRLPREWGQWAVTDLGWDEATVRDQADRFRDHWIAKTGQMATKADWLATWRNWCRNAKTLPARQPSRHDISAVNYGQGGAL